MPLAWYPRLLHASQEDRDHWEVAGAGFGIHWPAIDEDLSVEGLLRGAPAPRVRVVSSKKPFEWTGQQKFCCSATRCSLPDIQGQR